MAGDILQGSNWGTPGNWSSSAIPTAGDLAIVSGSLTDAVEDSGGDAKDIDLGLLQTHMLYNGSFGSTGSPIITVADLVQHWGQGPFYFESDSGTGGTKETDLIHILPGTVPGATGVRVEIGSADSQSAGNRGNLNAVYVYRGNVTFKANVMWDNTNGRLVVGQVTRSNDATVTIAEGGDTLPLLEIYSGLVTSGAPVTSAKQYGGKLIVQSQPIITLEIMQGLCEWNDQTVGGDAVAITVHPGATLDTTQKTNLKVISAITLLPMSNFITDTNLTTVTTLNDYRIKMKA